MGCNPSPPHAGRAGGLLQGRQGLGKGWAQQGGPWFPAQLPLRAPGRGGTAHKMV